MRATLLAVAATVMLTAPLAAADLAARPLSGDAAGPLNGGAAPAARAAVLPVDGPVVRPFDPPPDRYGRGHRGVDIAAPPGAVVRAALPGVVRFSGQVAGPGWVTVDHGGGLVTTYGDLSPRTVGEGDLVRAGEPLGRLGPRARHLDWSARVRGDYIDPLRLFGRWRAQLVPLPE